jgi:hypothetical protein
LVDVVVVEKVMLVLGVLVRTRTLVEVLLWVVVVVKLNVKESVVDEISGTVVVVVVEVDVELVVVASRF